MLAASVGVPFIALSTTSPLLQAWLARSGSKEPFRMFAVSNFASLVALLAYPTLIEPLFGTRKQSIGWSLLYVCFAALCAAVTWQTRNVSQPQRTDTASPEVPAMRKLLWFGLAACGSMLLLAVTNHIDENVAAVPLIWILPLAVYLLSFVFSFGAFNIYKRSLWIRLLAFALATLGYAIYNINSLIALQISLPTFSRRTLPLLPVLSRRVEPAASPCSRLDRLLSADRGGWSGRRHLCGPDRAAAFQWHLRASNRAPIYRATCFRIDLVRSQLGSHCLVGGRIRLYDCGRRNERESLPRELALSAAQLLRFVRVVQTPHAGPDQQRILFHGTIEHGSEFLLPPRRSRPTTYYGPDSGVGILLREAFAEPKRVAIIGLGAGTLATYGHSGDEFRFYEINSQVVDIAQALFFYLRESHAKILTTIGDGRLSLEREHSPPFDAIVLDAFSGDAIPVHLLTREALALYLRHLTARGVIAFHVSNDFLDLAPIVEQLAADAGYEAVLVHNHEDSDEAILAADWVLVTNNQAVLRNPAITVHARAIVSLPGLRLWTDDYNNLFSVLKTPELRRGAPR